MTHRRRILSAAVGGVLLLAACGGSDAADTSADDGVPAVTVPDAIEVDPASDVETNLLPDLVVDNLNDDNKVNLRNYGTGDTPILLWMWAPY